MVAALTLAGFARAEVTRVPVATEANVRGGTSATTDVDEVTQGYIMIKNDAALNAARKAYFQFNLAGTSPNTNYPATLTIRTGANSQRQHVQVWGLNQPYPAFDPSITWNSAQANDTAGNGMLTDGPFTATLLADAVVASGANVTHTFNLSAPWGHCAFDDKLILVLATVNDATNQSNGLRLQRGTAELAFQVAFGIPPFISAIGNLTVPAYQGSVTNSFTVEDDGGADTVSLTASSSNEAAVPSTSIFLEGSGATRQVYVIAGSQAGTADITVTGTDNAGNLAQRVFTVTVLPENLPPTISALAPVTTVANAPSAAVPFVVNDPETPNELTVVGTSGNPALIDSLDIVIEGTGTNRTVTLLPQLDQTGVVPITLTVSDGFNSSSTTFALMVVPARDVVFCDHFDYPDGNLNSVSANFWYVRGSGSTRLQVAGKAALIRSGGSAESLLAPLAWSPYAVGSRAVFYTSFTATWTAYPGVSGAIVHLNDGTLGVPGLVGRVATGTNGTDGVFQLRIANGPGPYVELPRDLTVGVPYRVVTRYDVDTATTALWIDATSEAEAGVSATDLQVPVPIYNVGFRQNVNMGTIQIDDLKVSLATRPLVTRIGHRADTVTIEFAAGPGDTSASFGLAHAPDVAGPYADVTANIESVAGGTFRATLPASGSQSFYRVKRQAQGFQ